MIGKKLGAGYDAARKAVTGQVSIAVGLLAAVVVYCTIVYCIGRVELLSARNAFSFLPFGAPDTALPVGPGPEIAHVQEEKRVKQKPARVVPEKPKKRPAHKVGDEDEEDDEDKKEQTRMAATPTVHKLQVTKVYSHDKKAFTQGLLYLGKDTLYESTGLYGRSTVRRVDLKTGQVLEQVSNDKKDFGEGLAYYKGSLWQLVWQSRRVIQYDARTLQKIGETSMPEGLDFSDGWGLTSSSDGVSELYPEGEVPEDEELYLTDSGTKLYKVEYDGEKFVLKKKVTVRTSKGTKLQMPNELELIDNEVWANIYGKDCIARINPETGHVTGWVVWPQLREIPKKYGLSPAGSRDVFNGIAYDRLNKRIWVTGKLWNKIFEVQLAPADTSEEDAERACAPTRNIFRR